MGWIFCELPPELLGHIVSFTEATESLPKVFELREVCKHFCEAVAVAPWRVVTSRVLSDSDLAFLLSRLKGLRSLDLRGRGRGACVSSSSSSVTFSVTGEAFVQFLRSLYENDKQWAVEAAAPALLPARVPGFARYPR